MSYSCRRAACGSIRDGRIASENRSAQENATGQRQGSRIIGLGFEQKRFDQPGRDQRGRYADRESHRGRVDDIVVLSSGRNVLVPTLEERLQQHPGVHECVLFGAGRPYLIAVVSGVPAGVRREDLQAWIESMNAALLPERSGGSVDW